jgi:hypothetical protein
MGMPVGAFVRVKCTDPAIDLNNARLVAITESNITIASANGERYDLPKSATTVAAPMNWQRTASVGGEDPARSRPRHGGGGAILVLLALAVAGAAGWFWVGRRREGGDEKTSKTAPIRTAPSKIITLSATPRTALTAVAASPAPQMESNADAIDSLIENRCYGTAVEKLEQQIRQSPDDFKIRMQLLKVYIAIGDSLKHVDRVARQINTNPNFTRQQKDEAAAVANSQRKERSVPAPAVAAPVPKQIPTPARAANSTPSPALAEILASVRASASASAGTAAGPTPASAATVSSPDSKPVSAPVPDAAKPEAKPPESAK